MKVRAENKQGVRLKYQFILFFTLFVFSLEAFGEHPRLFSIERSRDANIICYSLNLDKSNRLQTDEPIQVNWLMKTNDNKTSPLSWVQNRFSYGIVYLVKTEAYAKFHFAGYKARVFELKKNQFGAYKVFTISEGKEVEVDRIFIYITSGTFWMPEIPKVELYAKLVGNGQPYIETIKI